MGIFEVYSLVFLVVFFEYGRFTREFVPFTREFGPFTHELIHQVCKLYFSIAPNKAIPVKTASAA